jgi:hypothetical protein
MPKFHQTVGSGARKMPFSSLSGQNILLTSAKIHENAHYLGLPGEVEFHDIKKNPRLDFVEG